MLLSCWESVSSQDSAVQGFLRRDVVLPCSYEGPLEDVNVHWRDGGNNVLLDIIKGMEVLKSQDQKYKGRVSSFPEEYIRGNFSILIKNLQQEDAGIYECHIAAENIIWKIRLQVSEEGVEKRTGSSNGAAGTDVLHVAFLSALSLLLCF